MDPQTHPHLPDDELENAKALRPMAREMFQRYIIEYHLGMRFTKNPDWFVVGFHIEDAVYAPLYYGYGKDGGFPIEREAFARHIDSVVEEYFPGTVLVLLRASPEMIAKRMREKRHPDNVIKADDIESLIGRFDEEYKESLMSLKFVLDTTNATQEETLNEFIKSMTGHFSDTDTIRMLHRQCLKL
jgi:hypothetical protein